MADTLSPVLEGGVPPPPPSIDNEPSLAGIQPIPTKSTTPHTRTHTLTPATPRTHSPPLSITYPPSNCSHHSHDNATACPCVSRKVLMIVNSFIINTVDFLNKLNAVSEQKLRQVQQHIQRVEITLALLEGKLDSVPWLTGDLPPPSTSTAAAPTNGTSPVPSAPSLDSSSPSPPPPPSASPSPPPRPLVLLKDDIRYKKYFKMLTMGVPRQALRGKVAADGLDPDVMDMDPEGPAPEGAEAAGGRGREEMGGGGGESSGSESDSGSDSD